MGARAYSRVVASSHLDLAPATEPIPTMLERPAWRDTFSSLRIRNYRLYVIASAVSSTAVWMQRIAVDWLMLELTGSVTLVGITVALQFAPNPLFGVWGGVIADRYSKRGILLITQSVVVALCAGLAALTIAGTVQAWQVLLAAFLLGTVAAIDAPARSAFVTEMVGTGRLRNAISVNASIFHLGGLLGPAVSGALIVVVGSGWSIGVNALAGLVVIAALTAMRPSELRRSPRLPRERGQIRAALRYVSGKPAIFWSMLTLAFVSTFGMSLPVLLTAMADDVYRTGAAGYGVYSSLATVGAFLGAVLSTRRTSLRLRTIVGSAIVFGVITAAVGVLPSAGVFAIALIGVGMSRLLFATGAESLTQLSSNSGIRGRIMSLYIMVLLGVQAVGGPLMGYLAEEFGARTAFAISGLVPAAAGLAIALVLSRSGRLEVRVDLRRLRAPLSIVRCRRAVRAGAGASTRHLSALGVVPPVEHVLNLGHRHHGAGVGGDAPVEIGLHDVDQVVQHPHGVVDDLSAALPRPVQQPLGDLELGVQCGALHDLAVRTVARLVVGVEHAVRGIRPRGAEHPEQVECGIADAESMPIHDRGHRAVVMQHGLGAHRPVDDGGRELPQRGVLRRVLPAVDERCGHQSGG